MSHRVTILFGHDLNAKWQSVEHQLREFATVLCFKGTPDETLAYGRSLSPCVLVVDESFLGSVRFEPFCDAVEFGRAIRVLAEVEGRDPARNEYLIRMGCVGILDKDAGPATALRAVEAIAGGELWLDRKAVGNIIQHVLRDMKCGLTVREAEILSLMAEGLKNQQIADRLFISPQTVRWHLRSLYRKIGTHDRVQVRSRRSGTTGARCSSSNDKIAAPSLA